jgi:hypothetical protein
MLPYIPRGRENAIKRSELCRLSGLPDRKMRKEIERLQKEGYDIVNLGDSKGYFISDTDADFYRYARQEYARFYDGIRKMDLMCKNHLNNKREV